VRVAASGVMDDSAVLTSTKSFSTTLTFTSIRDPYRINGRFLTSAFSLSFSVSDGHTGTNQSHVAQPHHLRSSPIGTTSFPIAIWCCSKP
jgi:hypothetical protein